MQPTTVALESGWMVVEFYDALFAEIGFNLAVLTSPLPLITGQQLIVCRRVCYFCPKRCSPLVLPLLCYAFAN